MQSKNYSILLLLAILLMLNVAQSQGVSIAPPPAITSNILFTFKNSPNEGKLIGSERIESLELNTVIQNGTMKTHFKLSFFNRKVAGNLDVYNLTLDGNWTFIKKAPQSLSCSLVMQLSNPTVGLLYFDNQLKIFQMLAKAPLSNFTSLPLTPELQIQAQMSVFIGEKCLIGNFNNGTHYNLYRVNQNLNQLNIITSIDSAYMQAYTDDMIYGVYSNNLYRYNKNTLGYDPIFTFRANNKYTIKNSGKRLLVVSSNSTQPNGSGVYSSNYTIYIFNDLSTGLVTVGTLSAENVIENEPLDVSSSPLLTKLGYGYQSTDQVIIVAKHVDYTQNKIVDLVYQNPVAFMQTVRSINAQIQRDLSDTFLVVRNGSSYINDTFEYVEQGYQFVGTQIVLLNRRSLKGSTDNKQLTKFKKALLDPTNAQKLIVLDVFSKNDTHYQLIQFNYGNFASAQQIIVAPTPAYMNFSEPPYSSVVPNNLQFQWSYFNPINSNSQTNVTVFRVENSVVSHYVAASYQLTGLWTLLFQNGKCQVLKSGSSYSIYKLGNSGTTYQSFGDATSALSSLTISPDDLWKTSLQCDRLRVGSKVFLRINETTYQAVNNTPNFIPLDLDGNLTYAVTIDSNVWRFDPSIKGYVQVLNLPVGLSYNLIQAAQNRIIAYSSAAGSANVAAYLANTNGTFTNCLNYSLQGFTGTPFIAVSPKLTKVLVYGTLNTNAKKADMLYVDYQNFTSHNISFPENVIFNPSKTYVSLEDKFIYVRQETDASIAARDDQEFAYFFAQDIVMKPVFSSIYTKDTSTSVWVKSFIVSRQGSSYLLTETLQKSTTPKDRIIRSKELNAQAAELNSNNNALCQTEIVNGQVKMCPRGCSTCDCNSCVSGFVLDSSAKTCVACAPGCIACTLTSLNTCSSCFSGFFLNASGNCQPCQAPCVACSTLATSCTKCPPGQYFSVGLLQCDFCPLNCFNCTNASACVTCQPGFVLNPSNKCRKCSIKCSSCQATNITKCTSCSKGLQLSNGDCVPCPANCLSCSNGQCAECANGYTTNSNGTCVLSCKLPCITCVENQPTQCLSCQSGSVIVGTSCQLDTSCNASASCSYCGQGLNYYLFPSGSGAICLPCPSIASCIQCSGSNTFKCSICADAYYVNEESGCSNCSSNCTSCISNTVCLGCVPGFTLLDGFSQGQCLQCKSPCLTCQGSTTYCTSCVTGFTKQSWMCQNNTRISLTIVINDAAGNILNNIDAVVAGILQLLNQSDVNVLTLTSITSGSSVVGLAVSPTTLSLSSAASTLSTGLLSGIPGTSYSVSGIQVVQTGVNTTTPNNTQQSGVNVGLIVGLTVGLTLGVAIIVIFIVIYVKKSKQVTILAQGNNETNGIPLQQSSVMEFQNSGSNNLKETKPARENLIVQVNFEKSV